MNLSTESEVSHSPLFHRSIFGQLTVRKRPFKLSTALDPPKNYHKEKIFIFHNVRMHFLPRKRVASASLRPYDGAILRQNASLTHDHQCSESKGWGR